MSNLVDGVNKISNAAYHADNTRLSSSNLKTLLKDPEKFYKEKVLGQREPAKENPAFSEGSYVHALILEPEVIAEEFAFYPEWRKVGKDFKEFKEKNPGKIIISVPQDHRCKKYLEAYKQRKEAVNLIQGGEAEQTICGPLQEVPIKVRFDYINAEKGYIVDVKTSSFPVDQESFKATCQRYDYYLSAALYLQLAEQHYGRQFDFYFASISKKESVCEVYKLSEESRADGEMRIIKALQTYKQCKETGIWTKPNKEQQPETDYEILEV